jgi:high-affinity iron transporter
MKYISWNRLLSLSSAIVTLLWMVLSALPVLATGSGHHHHDEESSEHMQSMLAVKKEIPAEYQIMERTPIVPTEESLQQGRSHFIQICSVCHGEDGDGKGRAAATLKTPPSSFLDKQHSSTYGPGEKYWIIGNGTGETGMPAFTQFTPVERWHLVNFILHLQQEAQEAQSDQDHHHRE